MMPELTNYPILKFLSKLNIYTNLKYLFVVEINYTLPSYCHTWGEVHTSASFYLLLIFI